jgi:hypothetical protein
VHAVGPWLFVGASLAYHAWGWYLSFDYECGPRDDQCFRIGAYRVITGTAVVAGALGVLMLRPSTSRRTLLRWVAAIAPIPASTLFGLYAPGEWLYDG